MKLRKHTSRIHALKEAAHGDLMEKDPKYWSMAFFAAHPNCESVDNNFSEAFIQQYFQQGDGIVPADIGN
ncbi:hypothetical protein V6N13_020412 [Hibiscus sabdariffa]